MTDLIAFCKSDALSGGNLQIWTIEPNGTGLSQITHDTNNYLSVRWNPQGLNFAATDDLVGHAWIVGLDGTATQLTNLPSGSYRFQQPAWSPDGTRLAFQNPGAGGDIVIVAADNSPGQTFVSVENGDFASETLCWSPDGTKFAFDDTEGDNGGVSVCNIDGSSEVHLADGASPFEYKVSDWYPDSANVIVGRAHVGGTDLSAVKYALGGGSSTVFDDPLGTSFANLRCMAVSRDGATVAWTNDDSPAPGITVLTAGVATDIGPGTEFVAAFGISFGGPPTPTPPESPGDIKGGPQTGGSVRLS